MTKSADVVVIKSDSSGKQSVLQMMGPNIKLNPLGITLVIVLLGAGVFYVMSGSNWFKREAKVNLKELLAAGISLTEEGGNVVRNLRQKTDLEKNVKGETKEGAKEYVTGADIESHRIMTFGFMKTFPGISVISEEKDSEEPSDFTPPSLTHPELSELPNKVVSVGDIAVWVDPLDATQEYTEGGNLTRFVTTMACVAVRGVPTIGVIHLPFSKETYWGWAGQGYTKKLTPSDSRASLDHTKIIVSRSHAGAVKDVAKEALGPDTEVIPAGGAGYKTLQVIKGTVDAYVHVTRIKKWDICAGNAIINSVNGKMSTIDGDLIDYSASGNAVNDAGLLATLRDHEDLQQKLKPIKDKMKNSKH